MSGGPSPLHRIEFPDIDVLQFSLPLPHMIRRNRSGHAIGMFDHYDSPRLGYRRPRRLAQPGLVFQSRFLAPSKWQKQNRNPPN